MDHKGQVKIGNENFKQWLRELDPGSRVERMSAIAKTLAKMSLRGSEIKAALAQLSQRCQVMLVRLTRKEIKYHTRRTPLKRLQHSTPDSTPVQHQDSHSNSVILWNGKKDKLFQNGTNIEISSNCNDASFECQKPSSILFESVPKKLDSGYKLVNSSPKKRKKNELIRELFGDDGTEDITCEKVKIATNGTSDKKVNKHLSTTVYVNIFNGNCKSSLESNTSINKRKSHTENALIKSNTAASKRLRIDVSLSGKDSSEVKNKQLVSAVQPINGSDSVDVQEGNNNEQLQGHSFRTNSGKSKKKPKKIRQKSSKPLSLTKNTNSPEEDSAIRELWSILGMESPTERTAKFLSTPINGGLSDTTIKLHRAPEITNNTNELVDVHHPNNSPYVNNNGEVTNLGTENVAQSCNEIELGSTPETVETFLKISEPFSLAEVSTQEQNDLDNGTYGLVKANQTIINDNSIETIFLDDDNSEIETTNKPEAASNPWNQETEQEKKSAEKKSLIGTIRVKSWGSLADPQLQPSTNEKNAAEYGYRVQESKINQAPPSNLQDQYESSLDVQAVEKRFFTTYTFYFDELVESKIPKLGELLHLAIADAIRKDERIKRADQLSCEDLLREEKQRAEKKFMDSMKIRGMEFSPLCDVIIKRFEEGSKVTLFLALFCRILKHAATIDSENEKHILQARNVMSLMLMKSQYKDKLILDALQGDELTDQANRVRELIEKCTTANSNTASCPLTTQGKVDFVPTSSKDTQGKDNTPPAVIEERSNPNGHSYTVLPGLFMKMLKKGRPNEMSNVQSKTDTTINKIENRHVSLKNIPAKPNSIGSVQKLVITNGTQQPPPHHQTNLTQEKIIVFRETPYKNTHTKSGTVTITTEPLINQTKALTNQRPMNNLNTNTFSKTNNPADKNNFHLQPTPQLAVKKVNNPVFRNTILKSHLMLPARKDAIRDIQKGKANQELNVTCLASQIHRTPSASFALVSMPSQTATSTVILNPPAQVNNSVERLTITPIFGNTSVSNSVQQSSTIPSALSTLCSTTTSNTLPERGSVSNDYQQKLNSNRSILLQPRRGSVPNEQQQKLEILNIPKFQKTPTNSPTSRSVAPIIIRNATVPAFPAIVRMDSNQLRIAKLPEVNVSMRSSEAIAARDTTAPTALEVETPSTSKPAMMSPEVTSPTAEVNLPSSSHCHPFIARRPISSKLKMLFGNN